MKKNKIDEVMDMISLIENAKNFKDLEEKIFGYYCNMACECMKYILENLDKEIIETRDKKRYRLKNSNGRENTIVTLMGDVK
jgi:hypothetical protein